MQQNILHNIAKCAGVRDAAGKQQGLNSNKYMMWDLIGAQASRHSYTDTATHSNILGSTVGKLNMNHALVIRAATHDFINE